MMVIMNTADSRCGTASNFKARNRDARFWPDSDSGLLCQSTDTAVRRATRSGRLRWPDGGRASGFTYVLTEHSSLPLGP
jgi:hypothetical protein